MKQIYSKIMFALAATSLCAAPLMAEDDIFEAGGLRYQIKDGSCIVTSAEYGSSYSGDIDIPAKVSYNGNEYAVTGIGDGAFNPSTITSVKIGPNVKYVGDRAFQNSTLKKLNLPATVDSLAPFAFNCEIRDLNIEDGDTRIIYSGWGNIYTDSVRVAYIGRIFEGDQMKMGYKVESITFGPKLDIVPYQICYGCSILKNLDLGKGVKIIEEDAFGGVESLEKLVIPNQVEEIRSTAFYNCLSIQKLHFGTGLKLIGQNAFGGIAQKFGSLETLRIPANVDSIGRNCFITNAAIVNVILEDGEQEIRFDAAWAPMSTAGTVNAYIGRNIMEGRTSGFGFVSSECLKNLTFGPYFKHVPEGFADYCRSIESINCLSEVPPTVGEKAFYIVPEGYSIFEGATLYVPEEYYDIYSQADYWRAFVKRGYYDGLTNILVDKQISGKMFNLQGVEVSEDYKGIVIKNGKKYINR